MDYNKRFYDLKAEPSADEWYANETVLPSIKEYLGLFTIKNPMILDLGCGSGHESKRLYNNGARVIGIDYSCESIKIAKERNNNIVFHEMNYFDIDYSLGLFDGIFSCSSIIHLENNDLEKVIQIVSKVLKKDGLFLVIYRIGSGRIIQNHEINGEKIIRTIEQYEKESLKGIFYKNGFLYLQDGILDSTLRPNWDSIIFQKKIN
ncbi:MAG: class I SAM-dependent methyltransferase [Bacteroidales bacterium]|nr:class I SAM-dependent methyltransferase [Bacteroidales bacterium]